MHIWNAIKISASIKRLKLYINYISVKTLFLNEMSPFTFIRTDNPHSFQKPIVWNKVIKNDIPFVLLSPPFREPIGIWLTSEYSFPLSPADGALDVLIIQFSPLRDTWRNFYYALLELIFAYRHLRQLRGGRKTQK